MRELRPISEALAWLDAVTWDATELVRRADALGRVLAQPIVAGADVPDMDRAFRNGFAVRAARTEGASDYNPLPIALIPVVSGQAIPAGADAVLPFEAVDASGRVVAAVAREGVLAMGEQIRRGDGILPAGRRVRPADVALLAAIAVETVRVRRAPKVRLVVRGPKHGPDVLSDLLAALAAQDGAAVTSAGGDIVVVAGGGGEGADDEAPAHLDIHGIAIRPGGSSGLGRMDGKPLLLLPGEPLACLSAYALLAQPLLRRMGGLAPTQTVAARLTRKIVSGVGLTDVARVRLDDGRAEPLGALEMGGLAGAARADGYVVVPETSEGFPPGSLVTVHLWGA